MIDGLKMFRINRIMNKVRTLFQWIMDYKIEIDPGIKSNNEIDHNNIEMMLKINYGMKTFKLILQIFNVTYFLAVFWFIYCEIIDDYLLKQVSAFESFNDFIQTY